MTCRVVAQQKNKRDSCTAKPKPHAILSNKTPPTNITSKIPKKQFKAIKAEQILSNWLFFGLPPLLLFYLLSFFLSE